MTDITSPKKRRWPGLGWLVAIIGVVVTLFFWLAAAFPSLEEVTDPVKYPQVIAALKSQGVFADCPALLGLLPQSIPHVSSEVVFWHQPGFFQGGPEFTLHYRLPPADFAAVAAALDRSLELKSITLEDLSTRLTFRANAQRLMPTSAPLPLSVQAYGWKPNVKGAFLERSSSASAGVDFVCWLDPTCNEINYAFNYVK